MAAYLILRITIHDPKKLKVYQEVALLCCRVRIQSVFGNSMNLKTTFLILCVLGTLLPLSHFIPWVMENGLDVSLFFQDLFSTRIGGFFGMDVIVSAVVLLVFILAEGKRLDMRHLWLPVVATFSIGVSLGFPLFLYLRQIHIEGKIQ
jgi:hypothetical protein